MVVRTKRSKRRVCLRRGNAAVLRHQFRMDKMSLLYITCLTAIFSTILAFSYSDDYPYNVEGKSNNQTTLNDKDKTHETEITKEFTLWFGDIPLPLKKGIDWEKVFQKTMHPLKLVRNRRSDNMKSDAESSTLMKEENKEETTFVSESESLEELDPSDESFADMDIIFRSQTSTSRNDNTDIYDSIESVDYEEYEGLNYILTKLYERLQNESLNDDHFILKGSNSNGNANYDEDRCQTWLDNRERIERAFPGSIDELPGCPCLYPNNIFYEDMILDTSQQKSFRWRDASNDPHRAVYKSGSSYCVRSLPAQGNKTMGAQHCCYDEERRLLTRGSGAGTPYIVSPEISAALHDKMDLLPWRLCKGDFTRYNKVRVPNNNNDCEENPDDEEYKYQVQHAQNY